jgi:hypothetical protein
MNNDSLYHARVQSIDFAIRMLQTANPYAPLLTDQVLESADRIYQYLRKED